MFPITPAPTQYVLPRPFISMQGQVHKSGVVNTMTTLNVPNNTVEVLVQALTQNIRYTLDGSTPTASYGFRLTAGNDPIRIQMAPTTTLKFISETAGAILEWEYGQ